MRNAIFTLILVLGGIISSTHAQFKVFTIGSEYEMSFDSARTLNSETTLIVNGPLVHDKGETVGGLIYDGQVIKRWVDPSTIGENFEPKNGVFGRLNNGSMSLRYYKNKRSANQYDWAIQNGRILIYNGQHVQRKDDTTGEYVDSYPATSRFKKIRSGIGFTSDNSLVVIVSTRNITYRQLANKFLEEGCIAAIYLDGTTSHVGYNHKTRGRFELNDSDATKFHFTYWTNISYAHLGTLLCEPKNSPVQSAAEFFLSKKAACIIQYTPL